MSADNISLYELEIFGLLAPTCIDMEAAVYYYIVESKMLKIHRKIFSISSLVKISITCSFPAINFVFSKWRCL